MNAKAFSSWDESSQRPRSGGSTQTWAVLTLLLLVVLIIAGAALYRVMMISAAAERELRITQQARSHTLRLQLDEQSALRGYMLTQNPLFLHHYRAAAIELSTAFAILRRRLEISAPSCERFAGDEERINRRWVALIAQPALERGVYDLRPLSVLGSKLVDDFRTDDSKISTALGNLANVADHDSRANARKVLWFAFSSGSILGFALITTAFLNRRLLIDLMLQRTAYLEEKRLADVLQSVVLRKGLPAIDGYALDAQYIAAEQRVGGDWYDVVLLADGRIFFSVGDVVGHGAKAAITMTTVRNFLLAYAAQGAGPESILALANRALLLQQPNSIATALCGFVIPSRQEVVYASAGHPPLLAVSTQASQFGTSGGLPLGVMPDESYTVYSVRTSKGLALVLYSDGAIELDRDVIHGSAILAAIAQEAMTHGPVNLAKAIARKLLHGRGKAQDDIVILTIVAIAENS